MHIKDRGPIMAAHDQDLLGSKTVLVFLRTNLEPDCRHLAPLNCLKSNLLAVISLLAIHLVAIWHHFILILRRNRRMVHQSTGHLHFLVLPKHKAL